MLIVSYNNIKKGQANNHHQMSFNPYFIPQNQYLMGNVQNNQYLYGDQCGTYFFFPIQMFNPSYAVNPTQQKQVKTSCPQDIKTKNQLQSSIKRSEFQNVQKPNQILGKEQQVIYLQNRNVLPNNVSFIVSHMRRINKSGKLIKRIIDKQNGGSNEALVKKFFAYQTYLKQNCTDYVNNNAINALVQHLDPNCTIFTTDEQLFYNKVTRIFISTYLREYSLLEVLGSGKVKKSSIPDHLKVHRYLQEMLKAPKQCKLSLKYR